MIKTYFTPTKQAQNYFIAIIFVNRFKILTNYSTDTKNNYQLLHKTRLNTYKHKKPLHLLDTGVPLLHLNDLCRHLPW